MEQIFPDWQVKGFIKLGIVVVGGLLFGYLLLKLLIFIIARRNKVLADSMQNRLPNAFYLIILIISVNILLPIIDIFSIAEITYKKNLTIILTITVTWLLIKVVNVLEDLLLNKYQSDLSSSDYDTEHNLNRRKVQTQVKFLKRLIISFLIVIALSIILMSFGAIRQVGASLLASAGVVGVLLGLAAQRSISNILAGLQIAFTQPFKMDDIIVIDGYWGRVEEINLAYVVIKIWDFRRLVLPITYFMDHSFQNWTKTSSNILGEVYFYVDYKVPIREFRNELKRVLDRTIYWDRRVWSLQVVDLTERTTVLRALVSSSDASQTWELKCYVREKMLEFMQEQHPEALPRFRTEMDQPFSPPVRDQTEDQDPGPGENNPKF